MRSLGSICYEDDLDCTVLAHVSKKYEAQFKDEVSRTLTIRQIS